MLSDMIPKKSANFQLLLSSIGVFICAYGILNADYIVFKSGISFLFVGAIFLLKDILFMINYKEE